MHKSGRWSCEEHIWFVAAVKYYGLNWELVSRCIPTRTKVQCRTHAQKYFLKHPWEKKRLAMSPQEQKATQTLVWLSSLNS